MSAIPIAANQIVNLETADTTGPVRNSVTSKSV